MNLFILINKKISKIATGISPQQRLALIKFSLRRYYKFDGKITPEWFKTYSQPKAKRWFIIQRYLLYGRENKYDRQTFVQSYSEHEQILQKRYEQILAGGELGKKFHNHQLEFVSLICEKLGLHFPEDGYTLKS